MTTPLEIKKALRTVEQEIAHARHSAALGRLTSYLGELETTQDSIRAVLDSEDTDGKKIVAIAALLE